MNILSVEQDVIKDFLNGKINWTGEVLAKYEFFNENRVLHLETNGDKDEIYLEVVDYDILDDSLFESGCSSPIYDFESVEEVDELFVRWAEQN